jgi:hypothetical protein
LWKEALAVNSHNHGMATAVQLPEQGSMEGVLDLEVNKPSGPFCSGGFSDEDENKQRIQTATTATTTTTMTTMMLFFLFGLFFLLAGADAPDVEQYLRELLQKLETIGSNVAPPLPVPLMAAAVLVGTTVFTSILSRFAAAWSRLVRWASAPVARCRCLTILCSLVSVIDYLLSPFKLDDLKDRMIESLEKDLMDARENAAAAREHAATARENATTIREVLASTAQARDRATRRADIAERQVKQLRAEVQTFYHAF